MVKSKNKISDRAKNGRALSPIREPNWFHILNEIFAESNVELNLVSLLKIRLTLIVTQMKSLTKRKRKKLINSSLSN